jgi:iron(III) transport system permease protein
MVDTQTRPDRLGDPSETAAAPGFGARWGQRLRQPSTLGSIAMLVLVCVLVLPPVFTVVFSGFHEGNNLGEGGQSLDNYRTVFESRSALNAFKNTLIFATGSAILSVLIASVMAWLSERTDTPLRRFVFPVAFFSFGIPAFVSGMGWILLLGPQGGLLNVTLRQLFGDGAPQFPLYSMTALIIVQSLTLVPLLFLLVAPSFRAADPALEEAGQTSGAHRWYIFRHITLPLVRPSVLAAGLLSFIISVESFEIPALIGQPARIPLLSTAIYSRVQTTFPNYGVAGAFSTLLMGLVIGFLYMYQRATANSRRFATVSGKGYRQKRLELGRLRWPVGIGLGVLLLIVISPVLIMAWASLMDSYRIPSLEALQHLTVEQYKLVFTSQDLLYSAQNSFVAGLTAAFLVMLMSVVASWLLIRRRSPITRATDSIATLPLVVPGIVLSLAVLRLFVAFPLPLYGTLVPIIFAFMVNYLPFALRFSFSGIIAVNSELEEAASVAGARFRTILRRIVVPLVWPSLIAGAMFVFFASLRQLSLVVLLAGPSTEVIGTTMFRSWEEGSITVVAAYAMTLIAFIAVMTLVVLRISKRFGVRQAEEGTTGSSMMQLR